MKIRIIHNAPYAKLYGKWILEIQHGNVCQGWNLCFVFKHPIAFLFHKSLKKGFLTWKRSTYEIDHWPTLALANSTMWGEA